MNCETALDRSHAVELPFPCNLKNGRLQALEDLLALAHNYIAGITAESAFVTTEHGTRGGMASFGIAHMMDHFGQMVVYLQIERNGPAHSAK